MSPEQVEHVMKMLTGRLAVGACIFHTLAVAAYLVANTWTLEVADRAIFGVVAWDSRWLATTTALAAICYVLDFRSERVRNVWLVLMSLATWGRGLDLLISGSDHLDREGELKGFWIYSMLWGGCVIAMLLLSAYSWLYGPSGAKARKQGGI